MTIKDIVEEIPHMEYEELMEFRLKVSSLVENEILKRRSGPIKGWKCDVCGQKFGPEEADKCIGHVRREHRQGNEDASINTVPDSSLLSQKLSRWCLEGASRRGTRRTHSCTRNT